MEKTLIILKPDAVERRLVGEITRRFERKGLRISGMKLQRLSRQTVETHYIEHRAKPFFGSLVDFMTSGPVVLMVVEGPRAIEVVRRVIGRTKGYESEPGTIRGDLGISSQFNLIHGSDSTASAQRELELFFRPGEVEEYVLPDEKWFQL